MLKRIVRASYRAAFFSAHLGTALIIGFILPLIYGRQWFATFKGQRIIQWWAKRASSILGLSISLQGKSCTSTSLIVSNHISFLDIVVIASISPVTFLAKSTLRYWPIIGFIANRFGTIFIKRNSSSVMHNLTKSLTNALQQKQTIAVFPEGTTTNGLSVKRFHPALFQASINANKPVQPIALCYRRNGKVNRSAAYIDNDIFIITLIKIMSQTKTDVNLTFCNTIETLNSNRTELALKSHKLISNAILC